MNERDEGTGTHVVPRTYEAGDSLLTVVELQGLLRDKAVSAFRKNYLETGRYTADARSVSARSVESIAVAALGASGLATLAAVSPTLFMATANPATLMPLGSGVGSAVMGAGGIVGQAAFVPVASALPVVAPIMAMQALTNAAMMRQFEKVDRQLTEIKRRLDDAVARAEARDLGELISAAAVIDGVHRRYMTEGAFSTDMIVRLALAEQDVRTQAQRFRLLADGWAVDRLQDERDVKRANAEANGALLASFLDLRVASLRVSLDMQEHPRSVETSMQELEDKLADGAELWGRLLGRSELIEGERERVEAELVSLQIHQKPTNQVRLTKRRDFLKDARSATLKAEKNVMQGFETLKSDADEMLTALREPTLGNREAPVLVYWRDENGEHSFYTAKVPTLT